MGGAAPASASLPGELAAHLGRVLRLLAEGAIEPLIARTYALTDAAAALRFAESGGIAGNVVLIPSPND